LALLVESIHRQDAADAVAGCRGKFALFGATSGSMTGFRAPLIRELVAQGFEVMCVVPASDAGARDAIRRLGARMLTVPLVRNGMNPLKDVSTFLAIFRLLRSEKPDYVFCYNIKPIVYGMVAARAAGVRRVVGMAEGLGYAYSPGHEAKRRVARIISSLLYRVATGVADAFVLLNEDDRRFFRERFMRRRGHALHVIPGIGVDLGEYPPVSLPEGAMRFVMIARLLRDKGVYEYVDAARQVRAKHPEARFVLVGGLDGNPASIDAEDLRRWVGEGIIEYAGEVADVRPWLAQSHVFVLPTSYREGMPRTIIEALATGRPCVVTDVPGCRDIVDDGQTGLIVPPGNAAKLVEALLRLLENPDLVRAMSANALAVRPRVDASLISRKTIDIVVGG
jgi:glycosyltransferase involved in cell wall biosynthesis